MPSNKTWKVAGQNGFDSLKYETQSSIPEPVGNQVLVGISGPFVTAESSLLTLLPKVKIHAASLNYRDLIIPKVRLIDSVSGTASLTHLKGNVPLRPEG